jgi:hypothetical protein
MLVWSSLLAGLILGWIIEWVIDWLYWRRSAEAYFAAEHALRQELAEARREVEEANATIEVLRAQLERRPAGQGSAGGAAPAGSPLDSSTARGSERRAR